MQCPRCNQELIEVKKHGLVLDSCTACGGIWFDKGELAKIISQIKEAENAIDAEVRPVFQERKEYKDHYDKYKYKKKSTFGKIFDIFD